MADNVMLIGESFVALVRPGVPAKPLIPFVTKASVAGDERAALTWGAAQAAP
jgi:5,6,7,8-tetrahydromethanopterin hydro-lyase